MPAAGDGTRLLGRDDEIRRVRRAVASGVSCVLTGPPGIGKTALQAAVVASLPDVRFTPILRGLELLRASALEPWAPVFESRRPRGMTEDELAAEIGAIVGDRIVLVDDVQWWDPLSVRVLDRVVATTPAVVTGRTPTATYEDELRATFESAEVIEVPPLDAAPAAAIARAHRPGAAAVDIDRIVEIAGGNPLFIAFSASTGDVTTNPVAALVSRLQPELRPALAEVVAAPNGVDASVLDPAGAALVDLGLARPVDGRLHAVHSCVVDAVTELFDPKLLTAAHARLAERREDGIDRARHLLAAGHALEARDSAIRAADVAAERTERAALLEVAALADPDGDAALRVSAAEAIVDIGQDAGVALARDVGECSDLALERRRLTAIARGTWAAGAPDKDAALAALALTDPDQSPRESILLRSLLTRITGRLEWDPDAAIAHAEAGLAISERHDLPASEVRSALATALLVAGRDGWRENLHAAIELARRDDDPRAEAVATDTLLVGEVLIGDFREYPGVVARALQRGEELDVPFTRDRFRVYDLLARILFGTNPAETAAAGLALAHGPIVRDQRASAVVTTTMACADIGDDRTARDMRALVPRPTTDDPTTFALHAWAESEMHWLAGRARDAIEAADRCLATPILGFPAHQMVAPVRSWARLDLGDEPAPPVGPGYPNTERFTKEAEAVDALGADDPETATAIFESLVEDWSAIDSRYGLRVRYGHAMARLRSGDEAAMDDAIDLATQAEANGFVALARRARALVRAHGGRAQRSVPSRSGLVTGTQEEMLALVLEGLTTAQIAERHFVSRTTVDSTIAAAQQRLGAATRMAAAVATRQAIEGAPTTVLRWGKRYGAVAAARTELERTQVVLPLAEAPEIPWALRSAIVWSADVTDEVSAAGALRALVRGGSVLAFVADQPTGERFLADAARIAVTEPVDGAVGPELSDEQAELLALVRDGLSTGEIAESLYVSRRTAERRLARLREIYGVATNAELAGA